MGRLIGGRIRDLVNLTTASFTFLVARIGRFAMLSYSIMISLAKCSMDGSAASLFNMLDPLGVEDIGLSTPLGHSPPSQGGTSETISVISETTSSTTSSAGGVFRDDAGGNGHQALHRLKPASNRRPPTLQMSTESKAHIGD